MSRRVGVVGVIAALSLVLFAGGAGSAAAAAGCSLPGPFGAGRAQVWLLRPASTAKSVVLFAHGWTAVDPNDWHRTRFDHLCANGSIVLFPRYQRDELDTWSQAVDGFRRGVQAGFEELGSTRLPVVVAGFSFGGALVNYYAGNARAWKVPVPRSVFSMFPTTRVSGRSVGTPPASVRFVVLAGDRDEVVGTAGAMDFMAWLRRHPPAKKTFRLVRSSAALTASHEAPKEMTAASTRTFWKPIDVLVADARRSG
jgi:acetyl esterase/lipase